MKKDLTAEDRREKDAQAQRRFEIGSPSSSLKSTSPVDLVVYDLIRTSVSPISPIHVGVSPIRRVSPPPIIVCAVGTITITHPVTTVHADSVSSIVGIPSPAIPQTVTRVMAIYKLPALLVPIRSAPAALRDRNCGQRE